MATPFTITVFYLLNILDNSGHLTPVLKQDLPAPFTTSLAFDEQSCQAMRGRMDHPERYVCQRWTGEASSRYSFGTVGEEPVQPTLAPAPSPPQPDRMKAIEPSPKIHEIPTTYRSGQTCKVGMTAEQCSSYRVAEEPPQPPQPQKARRVVRKQQITLFGPLVAFFTGGNN
jgi:hypothetical protein